MRENLLKRIVIDPNIMIGKPIIKGTRLTVEFVVERLAQGWSQAELLRNYPGIQPEDILACLAYAAYIMQSEQVYSLKAA